MPYRIVSKVKAMASDQRANVAIITALCAIPLFGMIGLAIDYALAITTKAKLDTAADAAVVAAITKAQSVIAGNSGVTGTALSDGQIQGLAAFRANIGNLAFATVPTPTLTVSRTAGQVLTASITFSTPSQNQFGGIFNVAQTTVQGSAIASLKMATYVGVYMALDISQSMGIGATQTDMNKLASLTTNGCVFGCHVPQNSQIISNELLAHNNNVTLRIDSLKLAVQSNISDAINSEGNTQLYKIGLYTMGAQNAAVSSIGLNTLISATTNLTMVQNAANGIDLGANNSSGVGDTNFSNALVNGTTSNPTPFVSIVPTSGDGSSISNAINYAMIITDSVQDLTLPPSSCPSSTSNGQMQLASSGHCTSPFDPTVCATLKQKNVIVQVLYTTYLPFTNESTYMHLVDAFNDPTHSNPNNSQIRKNLLACASGASNFCESSDATGIAQAMQAMFAQATKKAALTN